MKAARPSADMPTSIAVAGGLTTLDDCASSTIASPGSMTTRPSAAESLLRSPVGLRWGGGFDLRLGAERHLRFVSQFAGAQAVGIEHRVQQRRRCDRAQQLDIWNYAMTANEAGEVFGARQEIHFLEEIECFYIIGIDLIRVPVEFLSESDEYSEVGSLSELSQLESLQLTNALSSHAGCAEVFGGAIGGIFVGAGDELAILQQVLRHPNVFAAHRTIGNRHRGLLRYRSARSRNDGAVDDSQFGLEALDIRQRDGDEVVLPRKRKA